LCMGVQKILHIKLVMVKHIARNEVSLWTTRTV
jgi:hypothetical protein